MPELQVFGNNDPSLSANVKCYLIQEFGGEFSSVCGVIGEGTTKEIVANWESPFEDSSIGSMFKKVGGAIQKITDATSISTLSSTQVWGGNEPYLIDLELIFYALSDPWKEVEGALKALEKMIAPEVNKISPLGRVPQPVMIELGSKMSLPDAYMKSLSIPLGVERNSEGRMVRATVNLQIGSINMQNRSDIDAMYQ